MEVTSILSSGSPGRPQPVELTVERQNREWLISEVSGEGMVTEVPQDTVPELSPDSDVAQAVAVLQAYYEAINARKYSSAYALWGSGGEASGQDYFDFMDGFAGTRSVELITDQPGSIEGAAGSRYIEIPVRIRAELWGGLKQRLAGTYTLRRSMVDGATDEEQQWRIYKAHIEEKD